MRYPDLFRNALMSSHQAYTRGEFWYNETYLAPINVVTGSVSADRAGSVRRTAQVGVDPNVAEDPAVANLLTPYGTHVKLFRGIRYPNGQREEYQVFYGRIDQVERSLQNLSIHCSDRSADIVDARFENRAWAGNYGTIGNATTGTCAAIAKALILEVFPTASVTVATTNTTLVRGDTGWDRERSDALDSLCTQIGAEWFADMFGAFHIRTLPAVADANTPIVWVIDAGDSGVLINRNSVDDRQNVYNHVVVISEPFNGVEPARGYAKDTDPTSPTRYGGPFGKVTGFYEGQHVDSNINAGILAGQLLQQGLAAVQAITVDCVANPKLQLADVVRVFYPSENIDAMYFVQAMELPLDPESPMRLTLYSARQQLAANRWGPLRKGIPEGASWQPSR